MNEFSELEPRNQLTIVVLPSGLLSVDGVLTRPIPDWFGDISVAETRNEMVVGAGYGGGPRVRVFDKSTGEVEQDFFAFDTEFRGGVRVDSGADDYYVCAGKDGGPVWIRYDAKTSIQEDRQFYGNPESREGLDHPPDEAIQTFIRAQPLASNPGEVWRADLELSYFTKFDANRFNQAGCEVKVFGGFSLFNVPELDGIPGPSKNGPGGTFDKVAYVSEKSPLGVASHEVSHLMADIADDFIGFVRVWLNHRQELPTIYERADIGEAQAGTLARDRLGQPNPPAFTNYVHITYGAI